MNYKKEIKLLIETNLNLFCSEVKYLGIDNCYHFLYKTVNCINNKIYIGIKSSIKNPDECKYIASGIYRGRKIHSNLFGKSWIKSAIEKHGAVNFKREDLLFFKSREDAAKAERFIVNEEFVQRSDTYNLNLGGGIPPRRVGAKNGNFNNRWTKEQKLKLSQYFKDNRDTKGSKNNKARVTHLYDAWEDSWETHPCLKDICDKFNWKYNTALTSLQKETITAKRYILCYEKHTKKRIEEIINNSRFKKQIYANCKKY